MGLMGFFIVVVVCSRLIVLFYLFIFAKKTISQLCCVVLLFLIKYVSTHVCGKKIVAVSSVSTQQPAYRFILQALPFATVLSVSSHRLMFGQRLQQRDDVPLCRRQWASGQPPTEACASATSHPNAINAVVAVWTRNADAHTR